MSRYASGGEAADWTRAYDLAPAAGAAPAISFDPLSSAAPDLSARQGITREQKRALMCAVLLAIVVSLAAPQFALAFLTWACSGVFAALIAMRWVAAFTPPAEKQSPTPPDIFPLYSILCPVYREAETLPGLINALDQLNYPRQLLDALILIEAEDWPTRAAAENAAYTRPWLRVVLAPADGPRTKPKALNAGFAQARGELLVVFDAEDRPHPDQLIAAAAAFAKGGGDLACVQAPLNAYNGKDSWIAGQFAIEYAVQFTKLLPLYEKLGWPILLGGTSNHFRTSILRQAHGWDSYNVTEDADLGLRLARAGYRTGIIAPPTLEEAPITLPAWRRQRTRWIKGHLMTWLVHMRRPMTMLREVGPWKFLGVQLTLGGGLLSSFAHAPLLLAVLWQLIHGADIRAVLALACLGYAGAFLCAMRAAHMNAEHFFLKAALTAPLYWPLQSWAACLALIELIRAPHVWAKTQHGLTKTQPPAETHAQIASLGAEALYSPDIQAAE